MARKRPNVECPITILTDEEFNSLSLKENKSSFLDNLRSASATSGFSARKIRERKEKANVRDNTPLSPSQQSEDSSESFLNIPERMEYFDDDRWGEMLAQFDEISPIEDITDEERNYYRRKNDGDKFDDLFKKEHSMLNDILGDIQKRSKLINNRINSMGGKGSYGVSKTFVELVEAGTSMDTTKLQIIKAMADLKKTATDLRLKEQKANPDEGNVETKDTVADRFYKSIISGGSRKFIESSMAQHYNLGYGVNNPGNFNISQPIENHGAYSEPISVDDVDAHGYIRNELRNVDICIYRYPDGRLEFAAVDGNGDQVFDYELPSDELLETIDIKPMSKYGYDEYQRKYRIIDMDESIDYDDPRYDTATNDDKYSY